MMRRQDSQKGATLLELVVGMAIFGMIAIGTVTLLNNEVTGTAAARASVTTSDQIRGAARWLCQDGSMAESTNLVDGAQPVDNLALSWVERYECINLPHTCSYTLSGDELRRDYDGTVTTVAQYISGIKFSQTGDVLIVSISCTPPWIGQNQIIEKTYRIYLRAASGG
jgi:prepilin-type N-terminal cleavage/methylation domain-containing protein